MNTNHPIRAVLLHLSYNMWGESDSPDKEGRKERPFLRFDYPLWQELTQRMVDNGLNTVVLDIGDGIQYKSHPEIAVENAWTVDQLKEEQERLKEMGLELIPKLNFSASHDTWLGPYARCVSTPTYYKVCQELIQEVIEILGKPRFFHLGMDEETAGHQRNYNYVVIRQHNLIWHDLNFLCDCVTKQGVRPWMWSDMFWHHADEFLKHVPKNVLQSNWYYGEKFDFSAKDSENELAAKRVDTYRKLDDAGYEQVPTCSNHSNKVNTGTTVKFSRAQINKDRLKGFLQTPWKPTINENKEHLLESIDLLGSAI